MSIWSTVNKGLDVLRVCTAALELISDLVKKKPNLDTLDVIGKIADQVKDVMSGKLDPAKAKLDLEKMRADLAHNNADVDEHINEKFSTD